MPSARVVGQVGRVGLDHDGHTARLRPCASQLPGPRPEAPGPYPRGAVVRTRDPAVVEFGAERARVLPWRGSTRTAYLAPVPDASPPSSDFIERCVQRLSSQGYAGVVTPALAPAEQRPFLRAGFEAHEELHLLAHDLLELPPFK